MLQHVFSFFKYLNVQIIIFFIIVSASPMIQNYISIIYAKLILASKWHHLEELKFAISHTMAVILKLPLKYKALMMIQNFFKLLMRYGDPADKGAIKITRRDNTVSTISDLHRSYDALQYPLIFWQRGAMILLAGDFR